MLCLDTRRNGQFPKSTCQRLQPEPGVNLCSGGPFSLTILWLAYILEVISNGATTKPYDAWQKSKNVTIGKTATNVNVERLGSQSLAKCNCHQFM